MTRTRTFLLAALAFALLCLPLLMSTGGGYTYDEESYHIPAIRQIRSHWPKLDVDRDSLSATAPGYHYFLATLSLVIGSGRLSLRLANWAVGLVLLWVLWLRFDGKSRWLPWAAVLPLMTSNFFVKSASWVVTDNAALLGMTLVLVGALAMDDAIPVWAQGGVAAATTFVRQLYVWLAVPVALQFVRGAGRSRLWALTFLMPLGVVVFLYLQWGGIVPKIWRDASIQGGGVTNGFAAIAYILAVYLLLGVSFYVAGSREGAWTLDLRSRWTAIGAAVGLLAAVASPTDFNYSAGRWGGYLWGVIEAVPAPLHRSLFLFVVSPLGGALLGAMAARLLRTQGQGRALTWIVSYCAWAVTFFPNRQVFQRYYEPATLIFLILWLALEAEGATPLRLGRTTWLLAILAVVQLSITFIFAYGRTFGAG